MAKQSEDAGLDLNKLVAELLTASAAQILESIGEARKAVGSELRYLLTDVFSSYLHDAATKFSTTKTLLYSKTPVPLYSIYVPMDMKSDSKVIKSAGIQKVRATCRLMVVTGLAGSGKSTFLKHLFLDSIINATTVPILIELRRLNNLKQDLRELILDTIQLGKVKVQKEHMERALASGRLTLLLDAFDEVSADRRESVKNAIFAFRDDYPELHMLVTSRPDNEFVSWSQFHEYEAMKLSKQQALELVDKLDYDKDVKQRFIKELDRALYKQHESFLSNPLLLTIMLLTYHDNAEIPTKKHLFFSTAFQALFSQHDARKEDGGFKRHIKSGLAMDDFQKVLAAVSIQSFLEHEITFTQPRALQYISRAKDISNIAVSPPEFLEDLLKAVCLLMQDGVYYSFTHKQFQEYYTAYFLNQVPADKQEPLLRRIAPESAPNEVIKIFHELNPAVSERLYVLPLIDKILTKIQFDGRFDDELFCRYFCAIVSDVHFIAGKRGHSIHGYTANEYILYEQVEFIRAAYIGQVSFVPRRRLSLSTASRAIIRERVSTSGDRGVVRVTFDSLLEDKELLKVFKLEGFLSLDQVKYLVDVRDFINHKLDKNEKSIDKLLESTEGTF